VRFEPEVLHGTAAHNLGNTPARADQEELVTSLAGDDPDGSNAETGT